LQSLDRSSESSRHERHAFRRLQAQHAVFGDPLVERAFHVAALALEGRVRLDGEPRLLHCVSTAGILAELGLDAEAVAAGLLHDVRACAALMSPLPDFAYDLRGGCMREASGRR